MQRMWSRCTYRMILLRSFSLKPTRCGSPVKRRRRSTHKHTNRKLAGDRIGKGTIWNLRRSKDLLLVKAMWRWKAGRGLVWLAYCGLGKQLVEINLSNSSEVLGEKRFSHLTTGFILGKGKTAENWCRNDNPRRRSAMRRIANPEKSWSTKFSKRSWRGC